MCTVEIRNAFVATFAEIRKGTAQILGAFPEWWAVSELPQQTTFYVVVQLELERSEVGKPMALFVWIRRPDGTREGPLVTSRAERHLSKDARPDDPIHCLHMIPVTVTLGAEGRHTFEVLVDQPSRNAPFLIPIGVRVLSADEDEELGG